MAAMGSEWNVISAGTSKVIQHTEGEKKRNNIKREQRLQQN